MSTRNQWVIRVKSKLSPRSDPRWLSLVTAETHPKTWAIYIAFLVEKQQSISYSG